jgi:hypothetical protein
MLLKKREVMLDGKDRDGSVIPDYSEVQLGDERGNNLIDAAEQKKKKGKAPRINLDEHRHLQTALKDQLSAPIDEYRVGGEGKKASGVSSGFVGTTKEKADYMLKPGNLDRVTDLRRGNATAYADKRDAMQEYIAAGIYKRILYDRTPTIGLADVSNSTNAEDKGKLFIKSKFFEGFQSLNTVRKNPSKDLEGFEKVMAACMFAGEIDYHGENLGVVDNKVVKIDHGRSGMDLFPNEASLRASLARNINLFGYGNIPLKMGALRASVNEIAKISEDEIAQIVASRIDALKKSGFTLEKEIICYDGSNQKVIHTINSYQDLEKFYVKYYKQQKQTLIDFGESLDIVSKIEYSTDPAKQEQWQNGQWLQDIMGHNPLKWAAFNGRKIEGKDAVVWAIENDKKFSGQDPLEWAAINGCNIEGKDAVSWAIEHDKKILDQDPSDWAKKNDYRAEERDIISCAIKNKTRIIGEDPISWAIRRNKKVLGQDPIEWAIQNNYIIEGEDPIGLAIRKNYKIEGKDAVSWSVDNNKKIITKENKDPQDPILYAINKNCRIEGRNPISWAIENKKTILNKDPIEVVEEIIMGGGFNTLVSIHLQGQLRESQIELGKDIRAMGIKRFIDKDLWDKRKNLMQEQNHAGEVIKAASTVKTFLERKNSKKIRG